MFHKIFKRPHTIQKHFDAPLIEVRLKYLQHWDERDISLHTLKSISQILLRIIEFLNLANKDDVITVEEVENAADCWARYQSNHPQKRSVFSKNGKERFIWYATNWLAMMDRLKRPSEIIIPLFYEIFDRPHAIKRHSKAALLEERLMYLRYWADNGAVKSSLQRIAQYLLVIMEYLDFYQLKIVTIKEIERTADCWAHDEANIYRKNGYSKFAKTRFIRDASAWLKMLDCLQQPDRKSIPFEEYLDQYINYMRHEQGLSENTIIHRFSQLRDFLTNIKKKIFSELTSLILDELLVKKYNVDGYSRRTVQSYASVIRSFLRYAENQKWCRANLADSIKAPRVYRHESLPSSPSRDDVKKVLKNCESDRPTDIRDRAILMLLSVYGMRCSEVTHLRLEDFDWKNELLYLRRAKGSKEQTFPLSRPVGEAILYYLKNVRQNNCALREVFLCMRSPYRPLTNSSVYQIVSRKLKPLNLSIKHHGPHALRHACATHLINEGVSLKEISDHLGHKGLETTRIYTKVDLVNLRKIAEFEIGDLL